MSTADRLSLFGVAAAIVIAIVNSSCSTRDLARAVETLRQTVAGIDGKVNVLNQALDTLHQTVDERLEDVDGDVTASSTAVRNEMVAMLENVSGGIETLRQTVDQKLDDIDGDVQRVHDDLDGDIVTLREEMNRQFAALPQLIRASLPTPNVPQFELPALDPNIPSPFPPPPTVTIPPTDQTPSPRPPN